MSNIIPTVILLILSITTRIQSSELKESSVSSPEPVISKLTYYKLLFGTDSNYLDHSTNTNSTSTESLPSEKLVNCAKWTGTSDVTLVDDAELIKLLLPSPSVTSKDTPGNCVVVLFYSNNCPFSTLAAPHFNAIARYYPHIRFVAINAMMYHLFNTQNGIVGVPSILFFHNGKLAAKYNESDYNLTRFAKFLWKSSGQTAIVNMGVYVRDYLGPVPAMNNGNNTETDIFLVISWCFVCFCGVYYFMRSKWWVWIVECVKNNWRDSEAQHRHVD